MARDNPKQKYNGYGACPLLTSYNTCILAEFLYDGVVHETMPFNQVTPFYYHRYIGQNIWNFPKHLIKLPHLLGLINFSKLGLIAKSLNVSHKTETGYLYALNQCNLKWLSSTYSYGVTQGNTLVPTLFIDVKFMFCFQAQESKIAFYMKKDLFPFIYWNMMLKGYYHGPELIRRIINPFAK